MSSLTYRDAGVDIDAGNRAVRLMRAAVEATHGPEVLGGLGGFGGLFSLAGLKGLSDPVLVASTDGVGTKTRVAAALDRYDTVGQDIVNHCVNDILVQGARPLFFLDYFATAKLRPEVVATVVGGAALACKAAGCALLGGETAEMPGVYTPGDFDLVGTIVGVVDRPALLRGDRAQPGDIVLALGSSGLHTNGFSLARKVFEGWDLREPRADLNGQSLGDALLAPHRSYLREVWGLLHPEDGGEAVDLRALAHITGGGLIDNPPRVLPPQSAIELQRGTWTAPPVFALIQKAGGIAEEELYRALNVGLGMLLVLPQAQKQRALELLRGSAAPVFEVGHIVPRGEGAPVRFV